MIDQHLGSLFYSFKQLYFFLSKQLIFNCVKELELADGNFRWQPASFQLIFSPSKFFVISMALHLMLSKSVQVRNEPFFSSTEKTKGLFSRGQHLISHIVPCSILPLCQETTTQKKNMKRGFVIIRSIKSFLTLCLRN